jgi:hypothetical protein
MFTQAMPAYIDALRQAVPANAVGPMAQALGNCAQPLTHRGGLNFAAPIRPNQNGTFGSGAWNPANYQNLFPGSGGQYNQGSYHNQVDLGGMNVTWNEGNRYDSQFFFPTNQVFTQNQFFGGPTVHVSGGQQIDYITNEYFDGDTVNVNNVTTQTMNGDPVAGPQGPPGAAGRDGQRGAPGAPGGFFNALPPGRFGTIRYLTGRPTIDTIDERVARKHRYIKDALIRPAVSVQIPTDAIRGGEIVLSPEPQPYTVPVTLSFDPDTCAISIDSTTTFYAFPSLPGAQTLTAYTANSTTVIVASTSAASLASEIAAEGFVVKGRDDRFWERNPASVVVARDPKLIDIHPVQMRVYRQ